MGKAESWFKKAALLGNINDTPFGYEAADLLLSIYIDEGYNLEADRLCDDMMKKYFYENDIYYKKSLILLRLNRINEAEEMADFAFYQKNIKNAGIVLANIFISRNKIREAEKVLLSLSKRGHIDAQRKLAKLYRDKGQTKEADYWENISLLDVEQLEKLQKVWRAYNDR